MYVVCESLRLLLRPNLPLPLAVGKTFYAAFKKYIFYPTKLYVANFILNLTHWQTFIDKLSLMIQ